MKIIRKKFDKNLVVYQKKFFSHTAKTRIKEEVLRKRKIIYKPF